MYFLNFFLYITGCSQNAGTPGNGKKETILQWL